MKIYDSLKKEKRLFCPINKNEIKFYQCGPTLYSYQHIGNLRSVVLADFIIRTLKYLKYKVKFVRNYTDVGHLTSDADFGADKISEASKKEQIAVKDIVEKYKKTYENDLSKLILIDKGENPQATSYIKEMIDFILKLLEKDFAYTTDLAVYFNTAKINDYHCFSAKIKNQIQGQEKILDENKKNQSDFALWFFKAGVHKNAVQFWNSPFESQLVKNGQGFPGWHIECSAMAHKILGEQLDIKMGGIEHKNLHHINEKAQSEAVSAKKYANFWLHNEHLLLEDGQKISKSGKQTILLQDLEKSGFKAEDLKYFFMQAHYRSQQKFSIDSLKASQKALQKIKNKIENLKTSKIKIISNKKVLADLKEKFLKAIEDDFNIPMALGVFNTILNNKEISNSDKLKTLKEFNEVLGLKKF